MKSAATTTPPIGGAANKRTRKLSCSKAFLHDYMYLSDTEIIDKYGITDQPARRRIMSDLLDFHARYGHDIGKIVFARHRVANSNYKANTLQRALESHGLRLNHILSSWRECTDIVGGLYPAVPGNPSEKDASMCAQATSDIPFVNSVRDGSAGDSSDLRDSPSTLAKHAETLDPQKSPSDGLDWYIHLGIILPEVLRDCDHGPDEVRDMVDEEAQREVVTAVAEHVKPEAKEKQLLARKRARV